MSQAQGVSITDLRDELNGEVVGPEDSGYEEARHVFFRGIDRKPAAVARVAGAEDVARAVTAARDGGLELAIRSGGHSRAGYGTTDGGIVIDLSGLNSLDIDADANTVWVGTGIRAGAYTAATGEAGRGTGLGDSRPGGLRGTTPARGVRLLGRPKSPAHHEPL